MRACVRAVAYGRVSEDSPIHPRLELERGGESRTVVEWICNAMNIPVYK